MTVVATNTISAIHNGKEVIVNCLLFPIMYT